MHGHAHRIIAHTPNATPISPVHDHAHRIIAHTPNATPISPVHDHAHPSFAPEVTQIHSIISRISPVHGYQRRIARQGNAQSPPNTHGYFGFRPCTAVHFSTDISPVDGALLTNRYFGFRPCTVVHTSQIHSAQHIACNVAPGVDWASHR